MWRVMWVELTPPLSWIAVPSVASESGGRVGASTQVRAHEGSHSLNRQ